MLLVSLLVLGGVAILFSQLSEEITSDKYFRLFALVKSLQILQNNPLGGLGPGMFGGVASIMWESPVYNSWPPVFKQWAYYVNGIDCFWPSIWGEFGILGSIMYFSAFGSIFLLLGKAARFFNNKGDIMLFKVGKVLQYYMVALVVMGVAGGLNAAFITYTYFALAGIYISLFERRDEVES